MRIRSTIPVLLSLVFSFPLIYQSLHYFEHLHDDHHSHETCNQSHVSLSHELCAVCEYEMATGDSPPNEPMPTAPIAFVSPDFFLHSQKKTTPPLFYKCLRAPPTIS